MQTGMWWFSPFASQLVNKLPWQKITLQAKLNQICKDHSRVPWLHASTEIDVFWSSGWALSPADVRSSWPGTWPWCCERKKKWLPPNHTTPVPRPAINTRMIQKLDVCPENRWDDLAKLCCPVTACRWQGLLSQRRVDVTAWAGPQWQPKFLFASPPPLHTLKQHPFTLLGTPF